MNALSPDVLQHCFFWKVTKGKELQTELLSSQAVRHAATVLAYKRTAQMRKFLLHIFNMLHYVTSQECCASGFPTLLIKNVLKDI